MNTSGTSDIDDTARLDWLLESQYVELYTRNEIDLYMENERRQSEASKDRCDLAGYGAAARMMESQSVRENNPEAYGEIQKVAEKLWPR